ncbi:MAG: AAA family ATPase [Acetobacteraceae bacterium]|nr:AAA family ATPase [Acetobacteraceae bacterium]
MATTAAASLAPAPLRVFTMGDLLDRPFVPREHLVFPWLREGESAFLWAATGIGKTMLAVTLALAVAGGGSVLGWRSAKPRRVLYLDGEMHAEDMRDRLRTLAGTVEGLDLAAARENLRVLSRQQQDDAAEFPDLASPKGQDAVLSMAREHGAALLIADNLSTLAELADENDAAAVSPVLSFLLRLKAAGIATIIVHHSGKSGASFRGSSKLATTFEVVIGLTKREGHAPHEGAAFGLTWGKFRGAPSRATRNMEVRLADSPNGPRWEAAAAEGEAAARLVTAVRSGKHGTQSEVARALGLSAPTVTRLKQEAIRKGLISGAEWAEQLRTAREAEGESDPAF